MSQADRYSAALIAMDADILPLRQRGEPTDERAVADESTIAPTQLNNEYRLELDLCVIGRDPSCHVQIHKRRTDISRRHATIKREDGGYVLYDHSLHGTFVNGQKINGLCRLDTDDMIGLANAKEMLRFVDTDHPARAVELTEREHDVLQLLAAGHSIKAIADELVISQNTVNSHLKNLYEKLGVSSRAAAVSHARKLRLL
jgi:ATP/maltotriose-dependent transcriptional regulator MalT